ncbi:hypothetical protein ACFFX0_22585 [Citricoccus parietis]|uniref:Uncharacterized protein n=1 Tax=Citricoccus parietis TaxID=592307 RepID=A0ABV5G4H1_9MICC
MKSCMLCAPSSLGDRRAIGPAGITFSTLDPKVSERQPRSPPSAHSERTIRRRPQKKS